MIIILAYKVMEMCKVEMDQKWAPSVAENPCRDMATASIFPAMISLLWVIHGKGGQRVIRTSFTADVCCQLFGGCRKHSLFEEKKVFPI